MGKFALMALPYELDALEPVISKQTLEFHHGKHLAAYVNNLNALLDGSGFEEATLEERVPHSLVAAGYGSQQTEQGNSSSHRRQMPPILYKRG